MAKKKGVSLEELLEQALVKDEDKPYDVPSNWVWIELGSICSIISKGTTPTGGSNAYKSSGIGFLRVENIQNGTIDSTNIKFIDEGTHIGPLKRSILVDGDILVSIAGTLGRTAIIKQEHLPLNTNQAICFIRVVNKNKVNVNYLEKVLSSPMIQDLLLSQTKVTSIPNLTLEIIGKCLVPLPPLPEQQRIVDLIESLFEKLDRAKELVQNALDSFEERKSTILHKAFTGELTANWRKNNSNINNDSMKEILNYYTNTASTKDINTISDFQKLATKIEEINNGNWYRCSIGAIGVVCNGSTPSRKELSYWQGDIPWVSSGEVKNNIIDITKECITNKGFNNSSVKLIKKGSVLIAMIGEGKTRGQTAILNIDATINQNIASIDLSHEAIESKYVWYWLKYQYKNNREEGNGTGPKALNCQRVRELNFILPPLPEQKEIVHMLDTILDNEEKARDCYDVIDSIDLMKKSILARAFRGELSTNNPYEESALELLTEVLKERLDSK